MVEQNQTPTTSGSELPKSIKGGNVNGITTYSCIEEGKTHGRYANPELDKGDMSDVLKPIEVEFQDARQMEGGATFEKNGFQICQEPTQVKDLRNDQEITNIYYPEIQALIKKVTGASKVITFDHTLRCTQSTVKNVFQGAEEGKMKAAAPAQRVHGDYTAQSAPCKFESMSKIPSFNNTLIPEEELKEMMKKRYMFINVWRNVDHYPVIKKPLAFCEPSSVDFNDIDEYEIRYEHRVGRNYAFDSTKEQYKQHKWWYFPMCKREECLFFKCYDKSQAEGVPRFVMHGAFDHPDTPADALPRSSLECRSIAVFDEDCVEPEELMMINSEGRSVRK